MAILHGNWIVNTVSESAPIPGFQAHQAYFFVWGEIWRPSKASGRKKAKPTIATSPYVLEAEDLQGVLKGLVQRQVMNLAKVHLDAIASAPMLKPKDAVPVESMGWQTLTVDLPSHIENNQGYPYHSASSFQEDVVLYPTRIPGLCCPVAFATEFLAALPLTVTDEEVDIPGADLRFWSHVGRWSLDLMARSKFVPVLAHGTDGTFAQWQPLLDSGQDHQRFQDFAQQMPLICRCYQADTTAKEPKNDIPQEASQLLLRGLQTGLDFYLRPCLEVDAPQLLQKLGADKSVEHWLTALGTPATSLQTKTEALETLIHEWVQPIRHHLEQDNAFRPCFHLTPPREGKGLWQMSYFLQALDDPHLLISADTVWNTASSRLQFLNRTIERPQERLLEGLGLASRIYPEIETSLEGARPTGLQLRAQQAYHFIKAIAWRLEDSGFGVLMPESLANREGLANRLGLHVKAETELPTGKNTLGLESLLNFKWELSIGGQTLSKAEFERLVNLDSPLVEINGEWVELRSQDIQAAQSFFGTRRQKTGLSLQDAIRIQSGDTHAFEKLPVVNFEASGILEELLSTLSGNQTFEPIAAPAGFQGTLRPYQERGVGWLTMLEKWGLGACLADDMGLGKTVQMIAFLMHLQSCDR
ncbi:MAG: ATP-dependent helicase, partial [Acaryochloridaceae cyanobacterium RL_2_7]|nr:ATP-dependent helicase [Acaryochloridaceae cyanobacterium RL_2_7]